MLAKAINMCEACDQPWRAASLRGGALASDPFLGWILFDIDYDDSEDMPLSGNTNRMLWKATCFAMSEDVLSSNLVFIRSIRKSHVCNSCRRYTQCFQS